VTATHSRSSRSSKPGIRRPAAAASTLAPPSPTLLLSEDPPLSLLDRWIRLLDRSPSRRWFFYLALPAVLIAGLHASSWTCGALPLASISLQLTTTAVISILALGGIHHIEHVAGRALLRFRPAMPSHGLYLHALTTIPSAALIGAALGGTALLVLVNLSDPTFYGMLATGLCQRPFVILVGWVNSAAIVLTAIISLRHLVWIRRIHAATPTINLFERFPLFAFSSLSSRLALLFAAGTYGFILAYPTSLDDPATLAYLFGVNLPLMLVIFIYPLYGMHLRMAEEKQRLLAESARRIERALAKLHEGGGGKARSDLDPHRGLTSLIEEESYLRKIPTWPWEPGTLTAVLTAVFLPLMLVVAQQVVGRLLAG
jgi:hypothetical protein